MLQLVPYRSVPLSCQPDLVPLSWEWYQEKAGEKKKHRQILHHIASKFPPLASLAFHGTVGTIVMLCDLILFVFPTAPHVMGWECVRSCISSIGVSFLMHFARAHLWRRRRVSVSTTIDTRSGRDHVIDHAVSNLGNRWQICTDEQHMIAYTAG